VRQQTELEREALEAGMDGIPLPEVDERIMRAVGLGRHADQRRLVHYFIASFGYLLDIDIRDLRVAPECCLAAVRLALGT
jgi:hypothetical protein